MSKSSKPSFSVIDQPAAQQSSSPENAQASKPKRWGMVVDQRRCIGCHSCTIACKSENNVPLGYWRSWVKGIQKGNFPDVGNLYLRRLCNQCDTPPCVQVCPVQATVRRPEDGVVVMYYGKCIGCGMCIGACPYDARFFNPIRNTADKCDFCVARIDAGLQPACVETCVSKALVFGDLDDPTSEIFQIIASTGTGVLKPEMGTKPKVFYIQGDHALKGRIQYSDDFTKQILEYDRHIPSPDAEYWKKGRQMETAVLYNVPHEIPWKIFIPFYFYFTGLSAGSFILSTLSTVFGIKRFKPMALPAAIISFLLLLLAPACLILDLHQPLRFWHTLVPDYFNQTSALSYGSWLLTLYPIANLVYIYFIYVKNDRVTRILGMVTVPLAIFVHAYTGFAFALVRARAWWHSALMPGYFLTSALLSGIALLFVVALVLDRYRKEKLDPELFQSLRLMMIGILLTDLFWTGSFWLTLLVSNADGHVSILYALHEKLYLWGEVCAGMLVPLAILISPWTRRQKVWLCIASLLIIGGVFLMRYSVVFIGFEIPLS